MPRHVRLLCALVCALLAATACLSSQPDVVSIETMVSEQRSALPNDSDLSSLDFLEHVKPVLDKRCVACHACFDAPCQFKATSGVALDRGASQSPVYHATRLHAAAPTRLYEDAQSTVAWRQKGFFSVLDASSESESAGLMQRFLELAQQNSLSPNQKLPDSYTVGLNRQNECPSAEEFDTFASRHPEAGMPYGLPALNEAEQDILLRWLEAGAPYREEALPEARFADVIARWEAFFNREGNKARLVSRYLYEHLYPGNLYFPSISDRQFFQLVRSATAPGVPVARIATRRPFDDPEVSRVYYRLVPMRETIVAKSHNPYQLDAARMQWLESLFFEPDYEVPQLPGYGASSNANPFITFADLPMNSRYRFMLEEARFTIANYIRGSVCRGDVAVSVIRDRFWVVFLDPQSAANRALGEFLPTVSSELALANSHDSSNGLTPLLHWGHYARLEKDHHEARDAALAKWFSENPVSMDMIWDGGDDGNANAALTVMRHGDYAAVEFGLLGSSPPETAWLIDYPLLERIHYLLVAGYDVFGALGHHLTSRMHMDFLRMQGEKNLLGFLPPRAREQMRQRWYREAPPSALEYMRNPEHDQVAFRGIDYQTEQPLQELYSRIIERLAGVQPPQSTADDDLLALEGLTGERTRLLPQMTLLRIDGEESTRFFSILRNDAHLNMSSVFDEQGQLIPEENTLTVLPGIRGFYPNALLHIEAQELPALVQAVLSLADEDDHSHLMDRFGIRRSHPDFWALSDQLHDQWLDNDSVAFGYLDYSRLENR